MAIKYSAAVKNAKLDALETAIGTGAVLKFRTGAPPSAITDADTGTVVATLTLPSDWMAAASGGVKAKTGTWQDTSADNAGKIGHFRIYASDGVTQHMQGTVTESGGGGDLIVDQDDVNAGQTVTVSSFSITSGN